MASKTEIAQMALGHIGQGTVLSNVDTDNTPQAKALRIFYTTAVEAVLRAFDWGFARKYATFNQVGDANPITEWGYAYRYPADCLAFRYIVTGVRRPGPGQQVPYITGSDGGGLLIYTDMQAMEGCYTVRITNPSLFPPDFVLALSTYLAILILPTLSPEDPYGLRKSLTQSWFFSLGQAHANNANESQMDRAPESEILRFRGTDNGDGSDFPGRE